MVVDNKYTRVMFVSFPPSHTTLPHVHSTDSVYVFLTVNGARVSNQVKGNGCMHDFMEFGEVRYGVHSKKCPLVHKITAGEETPVNCFDVEVKIPPPSRGGQETKSIEGHEVVKVREKVRVYKHILKAGESVVREYDFFHVLVVGSTSEIEFEGEGGWKEENVKGSANWSGPTKEGRREKNVGEEDFIVYVVQFREGWKEE